MMEEQEATNLIKALEELKPKLNELKVLAMIFQGKTNATRTLYERLSEAEHWLEEAVFEARCDRDYAEHTRMERELSAAPAASAERH